MFSRSHIASFMLAYNQVNVRRSIWVTVEQLQDFASRAIEGHGVRCWLEAVESIFALIVCDELATEVMFHLFLVLLFV